MFQPRARKPWAAALLLAIIVASSTFAFLPGEVKAVIPVTDASVVTELETLNARSEVKEATKLTLVQTLFTGIVNLMTFAANRLAYDAAVMLASGGPDETSLIEYRSADAYFADYASAVAGQAVGLIAENLDASTGVLSDFNLCAPDAKILLAFKMGIKAAFRRPEPLCEFNDIKDNWDGFLADVASIQEDGIAKNEIILTELKDAFDPKTQEFAVGIQIYTDILGKAMQKSDIAKDKLLIQGPTKDVVDIITGNVQTPASYIDYDAKFKLLRYEVETKNNILTTMLTNTDALLAIGTSAASVFTNTLLSELTNKLYSGWFDFDEVDLDPFDVGSLVAGSTREAAQERFASLLAVAPLEVADYDVLGQFASCPRDNRGLYNCVIDTTFMSAVARADAGAPLTLAEAVEEGLVDGGFPLIPSADEARNQDAYCYTYGFCHSNLLKLRKARIISVGWELAAESNANSADDPVTLEEVMDGYNDCNSAGELDANHPWCKLIDPNWVLKYPETQCRALVYGQLLETAAAATRQEECVDMPSCIAEDENGNCTGGYGYCVREANAWKFRGDSCPAYAASCITFEDAEGAAESFLLSTVDYGACNEANAGCLWYATRQQDKDEDGTFEWPAVVDVAAADAADDAYTSRIYFTAAVEECDEDEGGCAELYERTDDLRLNVLPNPSFEDDDDADAIPDAWLFANASVSSYDSEGVYARSGDGAVNPGTSIIYQEGIALAQASTYTLSYYARQDDGATGVEANVIIAFANENDNTETIDLAGLYSTDGCTLSSLGDGIFEVNGTPEGETYERYECTFTSPTLADAADQLIAYVDMMDGDVWYDDFQLEQGEDASDYHTGYSASATTVVAKVAPSYLGCTGSDTDPDACDNYAQVCSETEVGCTQYSPANGDPDVFGMTDDTDECPAACVGYDTFKQEPTLYEPDGDFPVYFIPDSAEACEEAEVGCDEFTRLDDESLAYFTYVRACVTNEQADANTSGDRAATFYTWEGSDLDGYQLVTWNLLESDMDSYTSIDYADAASDGSTITEDYPGQAPCTSWTTGDDGVTCNDDVLADIGHFDTDSEDCNEHDDIFENPHCREFYDTAGYIHYRDWSLTVTVNDACTSFRKTDLVGLDVDSDGDGTADNLLAEENCTQSGGYFDDTLAVCRYYGYEDESTSCTASAAGCREYTGGRSRNSRLVLEEQFEDGDLTAWEAASATDVTYSNESVATDGHSLASEGETVWSYLYDYGTACEESTDGEGCAATTTGTLGGTCTVDDGAEHCGTLVDELYTGKTYTLSFWAKGTGDMTVGFDMGADPAAATIGSSDPSFGTVTLSASSWEEYQVGPLNIDEDTYAEFGDGTVLVFEPDAGVTFYVDNIVLREGEDNITVIKDSWVTPDECDEGPDGTSSPQYYLGCQEYVTHESETAYLRSFSSLCAEEAVGCTGYFATHESTSPYAQVFGATCSTLDGATVSSATPCYKLNDGAGNYDTESSYLCTIGVGTSSCTFDLDAYIPVSALADSAYNMTHLSYGPSTHIVPSDTPYYLVVDDEDECDSDAAGCTEFGLPTFSADRQSVDSSTTVVLLNDPDTYDETLCSSDELFCAEWDAGEDGAYYFKDPQDQTCEYLTDVTVDGSTYDGWFRTGTSDFCYGTCASGANACSSDADCGSGDFCDETVGSYVIGGDQSGIWKNGDDNYGGWVGSCSEQYNGCSEFEDVLDITEGVVYGSEDGAEYFYLDNENLEENTLPSSQKCGGRVSQKLGCALFLDATESTRDYNASASYVASEHADALFGDAPFALVDPIDCDNEDSEITTQDGTTVDLCSQRCVYDNAQVYDLTADYTDASTYGASCYISDDCADITAESGEFVSGTCTSGVTRLENDVNRVLKVDRDRQCSEWLACSDTQTVWDEASGIYKTVCGDVSLCDEYSSDGNASFCSSWVDDSTAATLDAARYADRDVSWYGDEYSGMAIPGNLPVELLSQVNVAAPPGYCDLSNAYRTDTGSRYAYEDTADTVHGAECTVDDDCAVDAYTGYDCVGADDELYDLVYNAGSCDEAYGQACSVGYCQNTGEACATSDDCSADEGYCVIGTCYDVVSSSACAVDSDCSSGFSCVSGTCAEELGDLDIAYTSCGDTATATAPLGGYSATTGTLTLYQSVLTKAGSCVRDLCLLTKDGGQYDVTAIDSKECRGYPESDSPFGNNIVENWRNPDTTESGELTYTEDVTTDADGDGVADSLEIAPDLQPYELVTNFEQVNTCAAGENCVCSYDKVTFGEGSETRYFADNTAFDDTQVGVCVGGTYDGVYCSAAASLSGMDVITESACEVDGTGTCDYATRKDSIVGLEGYCLERDTGINTQGNRDDDYRACLTWLPVDQLVGSTDIYAKYTGAGYFMDDYVCTDVQPFIDLRTSPRVELSGSYSSGDIACAEGSADFVHDISLDCNDPDGSDDDIDDADVAQGTAHCLAYYYKTDGDTGCAQNAECPPGFWALMGSPTPDGDSDTLAGACDGDGNAEVADCPYACIPYGAYVNADPEQSCDPEGSYVADLLTENTNNGWDYEDVLADLDVYLVGQQMETSTANDDDTSEDQFDAMYAALRDCRAVGARYDEVDLEGEDDATTSILDFPASTGIAEGDTTGTCVYSMSTPCDPANEERDCGSGLCVDQSSSGTSYCLQSSGSCTDVSDCGDIGSACATNEADSGSAGYRYLSKSWDVYPACNELTQVAESDGEYKSYVWTDRVYNAAAEYAVTGSSNDGLAYMTTHAPLYFGMASEAPTSRSPEDPPFQVAACADSDGTIILPEGITECPSGYSSETRLVDDRAADTANPEIRSWIDFVMTKPADYTPGGGNRDKDDIWSALETATFGFRITMVFAYLGFGNQYTWSGDQSAATAENEDVLYYDDPTSAVDDTTLASYDARTEGNPPTIYALDLADCEDDACEEGEKNQLTLNSDNAGDQSATDFFRAYLKFYAAADKNQLPIRRVIVDWQDDGEQGELESTQTDRSGSSSNNNFYKNHRGLQEGSSESLCAMGSSEWGLTADSCTSDYFNYSHVYSCSTGTINTLESEDRTCTFDSDGNVTNSPCAYDGACYFRPRVHIRDNWGWCTGTCEEGASSDVDGTTGCFDGNQDSSFMSTTSPYSECAYLAYPSTSDASADNDPWVYYDGNVIVTP